MTYKKRGRAGWVGKKEAKTKIRRERSYAKKEITQQVKELEQGEEFRYNHQAKKVLTKKERLQKQLNWHEQMYEQWNRPNISKTGLLGGILSRYKDRIEKLKKKIEELKRKDNDEL